MLDAARFVESMDYYRRFIDFCAEWNINAVIFRLTDDQGCALKFRSHPELVTHPNALKPEDAAALSRYAAGRGIELIPEIQSFGHSHYITKTPEHADLDDQSPGGYEWANAMIPLHPKTMQILGDLYAETADLFPSRFLHAGCDETNWGGSEFSRRLLATKTKTQVWGEYLNALNSKIQALGREMIIWDDMVLQHDPAILDCLDREIILHDWEYKDSDPAVISSRLSTACGKGFRIIGGPALHWGKWGPRVGQSQLYNIDAYADACLKQNAGSKISKTESDDCNILGVIVTNWCPMRYIRDSIWDEIAYAAVAINEENENIRASALPRFVEKHYGTPWNNVWAEIFSAIYSSAPERHGNQTTRLPVPWGNDDELRKTVEEAIVPAPPFEEILKKIDAIQPHIRRNHTDFAAFRLSIAYLDHLYWRKNRVRGLSGSALPEALTEVVQRDKLLADALNADWTATRAGNPEEGLNQAKVWGFSPEDWLHGTFMTKANNVSQLAINKTNHNPSP